MSDTLNNQGTRYELDGSVVMDEEHQDTKNDIVEGKDVEDNEVPSVEPSLEAVETLSLALEWLRDVNYSIKCQGVSRADMGALAKIRQSLVKQGVTLSPTPSLESYAMATYLEERSGVNVSVATEAFASTMIATIKRWLSKLVDYVGQMVRWVAKEFMGEDLVKRRLGDKYKQIQALQELRKKLLMIYRPPVELEGVMQDQAGLLLEDDNLRNNRMTVAAFGSVKEDAAINALVVQATGAVLTIVGEIGHLKKDLESETTQPTFDDTSLQSLDNHVLALDEFLRDQPNEQYVRQQLENTLFTAPVPPHVLVVTPFNDVVSSYRKVHSDLKQIRKIDHHQDVDLIVGQLNELMRSIGNISKLASAIKQYNSHKLQALRQRAAFETIYINRYYQMARDNTGDVTMTTIKRTIESSRSKINGLGVDNA